MHSQFAPIALLALTFVVTGCESIYFDRLPGNPEQEIPLAFRGKHLSFEVERKGNVWQTGDSSYVNILSDRWVELDDRGTEFPLGDHARISKYDHYYFLSNLENNFWTISVIEKTPDGFMLSPVTIDVTKENGIQFFQSYFSSLKEITDQDSTTRYVTTTNEQEIIRYYEEYLKNNFYWRFILTE